MYLLITSRQIKNATAIRRVFKVSPASFVASMPLIKDASGHTTIDIDALLIFTSFAVCLMKNKNWVTIASRYATAAPIPCNIGIKIASRLIVMRNVIRKILKMSLYLPFAKLIVQNKLFRYNSGIDRDKKNIMYLSERPYLP